MISFIIFLCLYVFYSVSLQIDLKPGDYKCIGQELDEEDLAVFLLGGSIPNAKKGAVSPKLMAFVIDPSETEIIKERIIIGARPKEYQRVITQRGVHTLCFELDSYSGTGSTVRVFFHIDSKSRAVEAMEQAQKLGKSDLSSLEIQLKTAEDLLEEISTEIDYSTRQEILLREAAGWFEL